MEWFIDNELVKTKEGCIILLEEINAYRELDGQGFDFCGVTTPNKMSFGSEEFYYKRAINYLENKIKFWNEEHSKSVNKKSKNKRINRHKLNQQHKNKLLKDADKDWTSVLMTEGWNEGRIYPKKYYRGKRSSHLKKQSNRKIRRYKGHLPPKGNTCHKIFDFWWELD